MAILLAFHDSALRLSSVASEEECREKEASASTSIHNSSETFTFICPPGDFLFLLTILFIISLLLRELPQEMEQNSVVLLTCLGIIILELINRFALVDARLGGKGMHQEIRTRSTFKENFVR